MPGKDQNSSRFTRRRLLGSGAAAALGAASLALPPNVQKALASPPRTPGRLRDIKHVVMLMQENRSFDHYFGTMSGVCGFDDPNALILENGRSVFHQPWDGHPDGYVLPFHLDTKKLAGHALPSTDHGWQGQHEAWNGGKMDNWIPAHIPHDGQNAPFTMGYLTREDIPFHYALAESFTILDHYHCSVIGPTGPNRHMWMSGTIDVDGLAGGPSLTTSGPANQFSWKTYPKRLSEAGVSWKVYRQPGGLTGSSAISKFTDFAQAQPGDGFYENGVATQPLGQFEYDCMNDSLPTVSWILPPSGYDEHPSTPGSAAAGAQFIAGKIDAIASNPEVWAKTVFILSYDENDGLFDHVVPPTPPAGTPGEFVFKTSTVGEQGRGWPSGLGFRVPCIIVSPWTAGGYVCSEVSDHTSQLQFLEHVTGVKETNISAWRRETCGDLTSAFRFNNGRAEAPTMPDTVGDYNFTQYAIKNLPMPEGPPAKQQMPRQEKGHRPHVG
ncbi:alkaline phosphatase family protein [Micromonospora azadirachtae]|uniref:phospholipase C n=1 Tax=Micromonospora azadirachtae TaxID=1970735 RepID=A0ABW2ZYZ5_9ACTN